MLSDTEELFGANTVVYYIILKVVLQAVQGAFVKVPLSSVSNFLITYMIMCHQILLLLDMSNTSVIFF